MDNPILRNVFAVIGGSVVAIFVVQLVQLLGHMMFPPPEGLDITNPADQARIMQVIPIGAKITVLVAWFLGALIGVLTARKIGFVSWPSWIVTGLMVAASFATTQMFPHPWWMVLGALVLPVFALLMAGRMVPLPKP